MRHRVFGYKLGRDTEHRRSMFRNLAAGVIQHGQITTTLPKAKAVQPMVEKLISLARKDSLAARRRAISILRDRRLAVTDKKSGDPIFEEHDDGREKTLIHKLFEDVGPRYADRPGVIGPLDRTRALYGRVTEAHLLAHEFGARAADGLIL